MARCRPMNRSPAGSTTVAMRGDGAARVQAGPAHHGRRRHRARLTVAAISPPPARLQILSDSGHATGQGAGPGHPGVAEAAAVAVPRGDVLRPAGFVEIASSAASRRAPGRFTRQGRARARTPASGWPLAPSTRWYPGRRRSPRDRQPGGCAAARCRRRASPATDSAAPRRAPAHRCCPGWLPVWQVCSSPSAGPPACCASRTRRPAHAR